MALAVLGMLVAFVVFIAIHATNGFGFGESWSMAFKDFWMAFTCPQEPGKVWEFIDRSEVEELRWQIAQERGEDIYSLACTEGVAATTPTQIPVSIPTPVPSTAPVSSATPDSTAGPAAPGPPTQAPAIIVTATVPASPTPSPPPDEVLQTLVQYMLDLINDDRLENGLQPVILGTNPAAQQHAEEMLSEGYLAHWGLDGLKPYMRYTLSGGYNYGAENVSGPPYYSDPDIYRHENVLGLLKETQSGLMESPGHRRNILNKWHKSVNIGIAFNESAVSVVQQFEGDYIEFTKLPSIENGVLSFSGSTRGGFLLKTVQVWYDQAPHSLTLGQVGSTHCYTSGTPIIFLRPPAPPSASYVEDESSYTWGRCPDPYGVSPNTPPREPSSSPPFRVTLSDASGVIPWVDAEIWAESGASFSVEADISQHIAEQGGGVYTVVIWGTKDSESLGLTSYSVFIGQ